MIVDALLPWLRLTDDVLEGAREAFSYGVNKALGRSDIEINRSTYMRRWRLVHAKMWGVRLHHILRSDGDRELHDHPFDYVSFIFQGGYDEPHPDGAVLRFRAPAVVFRRAEQFHRLELIEGRATRTLVIRGRMRRRWGFMTDRGWMPWQEFVKTKRQGETKEEPPRSPFATRSSY